MHGCPHRPGRIPSLQSRQDSASSWLLARTRASELHHVKISGWLAEAVPREAVATGGNGAASYARAMSLRGGAPPQVVHRPIPPLLCYGEPRFASLMWMEALLSSTPISLPLSPVFAQVPRNMPVQHLIPFSSPSPAQLIVMGLLVCAMALDVVRYRISGGGGDGDANVGTIRSRRQDSAEILSTSGPSHAAKKELSRRLEEQLSNPNKKGARRHKGDGPPLQGGSPLLPKRLSSSLRVNPDSGGSGGGGKSSKDNGKGKEKETGTGEVMLYLVVREDLKMSAGKVASVRFVFPLCPTCLCPSAQPPREPPPHISPCFPSISCQI